MRQIIFPQRRRSISATTARLSRAAKAQEEEFGLGLTPFWNRGRLVGELCEFYLSFDALAARMKGHPVVYFDSFLSARFPESLPPKQLLSVTARQLPGYGGSLGDGSQRS